MILKALYDYYYRSDKLPAYGCELKEIGFLLVIDTYGNFIRFEDRRIDNKSAQKFLVKKSVGRTAAPVANHLYDNSAYVFGYTNSDNGNDKYFAKFKEYVEFIYHANPENKQIKAVYQFYQKDLNSIIESLKSDPLWDDITRNLSKKYSNFSYLIEGETKIIAEDRSLFPPTSESSPGNEHICLISGGKGHIARLHTTIKLNKDTGPLVALKENRGYDSYGKSQGYNAPICEEAEFAYTTALNHLLRSGSRNKFLVGNRTFVFWSSRNDKIGQQAEESLFSLFGITDGKNDNPDNGIEQVRKTFTAIYSGVLNTTLDDKFYIYILGLSPNSARIAVSYWAEIPLKEFAGMILKHFDDMEIIDTRKERKSYFGLRSILSAVELKRKESKVAPNLPEQVIKSIFNGTLYPQTLYASCIRRIRAEQKIEITRAAIIKAYLNRLNNNEKKITPMLDKTNTNQAYLCGRLFAVLDKIQEEANDQHSIKERYMNAASATPASVFSTILNLSSHHSEKLNEGRKIFFEKIKQEIVEKISANGFPTHLNLQDQGRFFVGYYHQKKDFYSKNENENNK